MTCDDNIVTAAELGEFLGVTARNVRNLADAGEVVRAPQPARYLLKESCARYCVKLRGAANRSNTRGAQTATLTSERARLAKEQADVMALKAAKERGELVPAAEVAAKWKAILTALRSRFLGIPSRVRSQIPNLSRVEVDLIDDEIRDALEELSNVSGHGSF